MAKAGNGINRVIMDNAGEEATVTDNRLDTNTTAQGYATVGHFTQEIADSATQLTSHTSKHVDIMADVSNTGIIYIGGSGVSATTGIALYAGDVYSIDVSNTNLLYAIATVDTEDINVVYYL
jgi:uncharacterized membrane protein YgdD (TMEM256/DUF423 family)